MRNEKRRRLTLFRIMLHADEYLRRSVGLKLKGISEDNASENFHYVFFIGSKKWFNEHPT